MPAEDTLDLLLDPCRAHDVPERLLGPQAFGIRNVDRSSAGKAMTQVNEGDILANGNETSRCGIRRGARYWAAMLFSLLCTVEHWDVNPRLWLSAYLEACAAAGGQAPSKSERFLPWRMRGKEKQRDGGRSMAADSGEESPGGWCLRITPSKQSLQAEEAGEDAEDNGRNSQAPSAPWRGKKR